MRLRSRKHLGTGQPWEVRETEIITADEVEVGAVLQHGTRGQFELTENIFGYGEHNGKYWIGWYGDFEPAPTSEVTSAEVTPIRRDGGKLQFALLPPEWETELARVLTAGAQKYEVNGWLSGGGMDWSRCVSALRRHLTRWLAGEQRDVGETECHHMSQVAVNALMLMSYELRGIGNDDRLRCPEGSKPLTLGPTMQWDQYPNIGLTEEELIAFGERYRGGADSNGK